MGNIYVKVSDNEGLVQESTGDFVLAINVQEEQSQVIVQGEFNAENYIKLAQATVKALVQVGHSNHVPAIMLDTMIQESFRLAVKDILLENGFNELDIEEIEKRTDQMYEEDTEELSEEHKGFDLDSYLERFDLLKNDIRLKAFRKLCSSYHVSMGRVEIQKQFETNILPRAKEIISIISPDLLESDLFINRLIEYGVQTIELEQMLEEMKETLTTLHELSIVLEVSTLEDVLTIQKEYYNARS
ncbi:hypothetical protein FC697_13970 [Bacillus wiedmannii]|uniref:hypothetical protein n=1 Tax=Bacillus wiedmannii TaxID=1890302 RepID=UPI000A3B3249|nr:hypothetical protein [Bacillus wiedmannii]OUB05806.1 hypothetical protein BK708_40595 [Bacillus thuringiensis serovar yunnanensis]TKH22205.1 hypothetical protein FC697_13970 [Bacillus wiedmannii]HDR7595010.1 hypothetical protein [Bacillus mycoides]